MRTYQDFLDEPNRIKFIQEAIADHRNSPEYKIAVDADEYDAQRNVTVNSTVKSLYNISRKFDEKTGHESMGYVKTDDTFSSNHHIASNFFHRLNTERCTYSLGNGVAFDGENVKEKLGDKFDTSLFNAAYCALKHGVSFGFWNVDKLQIFKRSTCPEGVIRVNPGDLILPANALLPLEGFQQGEDICTAGVRIADRVVVSFVLLAPDDVKPAVSIDGQAKSGLPGIDSRKRDDCHLL